MEDYSIYPGTTFSEHELENIFSKKRISYSDSLSMWSDDDIDYVIVLLRSLRVKAEAFYTIFSKAENDIMQVGDVGTRVLFKKMAEELDIFRNAIFGYTEDRREYFKNLNEKQQAEYNTYTAKKNLEELNKRWENKNTH